MNKKYITVKIFRSEEEIYQMIMKLIKKPAYQKQVGYKWNGKRWVKVMV